MAMQVQNNYSFWDLNGTLLRLQFNEVEFLLSPLDKKDHGHQQSTDERCWATNDIRSTLRELFSKALQRANYLRVSRVFMGSAAL